MTKPNSHERKQTGKSRTPQEKPPRKVSDQKTCREKDDPTEENLNSDVLQAELDDLNVDDREDGDWKTTALI
jgi:hypothetical protein